RVGDEELPAWLELDDRAFERTTQPAKHLVTPLGGVPLDRVDAERTRHAQRTRHMPPRRERIVIEERIEHHRGRRVDGETVSEFLHWFVVGGWWPVRRAAV